MGNNMKKFLNLGVSLELKKEINSEEELKLLKRVIELLNGTSGIIDLDLVNNFFVIVRRQTDGPLI